MFSVPSSLFFPFLLRPAREASRSSSLSLLSLWKKNSNMKRRSSAPLPRFGRRQKEPPIIPSLSPPPERRRRRPSSSIPPPLQSEISRSLPSFFLPLDVGNTEVSHPPPLFGGLNEADPALSFPPLLLRAGRKRERKAPLRPPFSSPTRL